MNFATVLLVDQDEAINGLGMNIVRKYEDVCIPDGEQPQMTLVKLVFDGKAKENLDKHNLKRAEVVNKKTLERTGTEVKLSPIEVSDLTIIIK
jgi:hypothetical protein